MDTILVNTSHNISIRYELASVLHRGVAYGLDLILIIFYLILVFNIVDPDSTVAVLFAMTPPTFYHLFCEILLDGQSLGKKMMKLRVVTLSGKKPSLEDYFLRWIFRLVEITATLGSLAAINITSTDKNQRIGDILARTTVIKVLPENAIGLDTLRSLESKERTITYHGVTRYSDKDMLLVKESLNRLRSQPNEANKKMILDLAKRISQDLDIKVEGKASAFLENALIDYIFLTR